MIRPFSILNRVAALSAHDIPLIDSIVNAAIMISSQPHIIVQSRSPPARLTNTTASERHEAAFSRLRNGFPQLHKNLESRPLSHPEARRSHNRPSAAADRVSNNAEPFKLSTALIAVHKDCYTALEPNPTRRPTPEEDCEIDQK